MIGKALDLKRGGDRYIHTAAYGHFGRSDRPDVSAGCCCCCCCRSMGLAVRVVFVCVRCLLEGPAMCSGGCCFAALSTAYLQPHGLKLVPIHCACSA
jgi:hypothetical protein